MSRTDSFSTLPVDILLPILDHLEERTDYYACTLVSRAFNRAATPLLYRSLDSSMSKSMAAVRHPCRTLLQRPELAVHVRRIKENGAFHRGQDPQLTADTLEALATCKNLESVTWIETAGIIAHDVFLKFLDIVKTLPIKELNIKTHADLGETVWAHLITLTGLHKVSIWCMEGPPRILQNWSELLGNTLTHLELGRCAGVPTSLLIAVLSQLPLLKDLRLKGAPATCIPTILSYLPNLKALDTEFLGSSYMRRQPHFQSFGVEHTSSSSPTLDSLTVRAISDMQRSQTLWTWIKDLVPRPGLETLKIHAYRTSMMFPSISRMFLLEMAVLHGSTLKHFIVGDVELTLTDVECLCSKFVELETIECTLALADSYSITRAIQQAEKLRRLKVQIEWMPTSVETGTEAKTFDIIDAREMMLHLPQLRWVVIDSVVYQGRWILNTEHELDFEVTRNVQGGHWHT